MLIQDQVAELLERCEARFGRRLDGIRNNLRDAKLRASAVWELVAIDAFTDVGPVAYEEQMGSSRPDITLKLNGVPPLAVEVAYLYPRNWQNERRARDLSLWVYSAARREKIPEFMISMHYHGTPSDAGPTRSLPDQHESSAVMQSPAFRGFFDTIRNNPNAPHESTLSPYTVTLRYDPADKGPFVHGSGPVEESPQIAEESALFRSIRGKLRQHSPDWPYVVCVGTDQSNAISAPGVRHSVSERDVIAKTFSNRKLSAVVVVGMEDRGSPEFHRIATSRIYVNPDATRPLSSAHLAALQSLNFNKWKFYFSLEKWDSPDMSSFQRSGGPLRVGLREGRVSLTIPSTIVVDCLAGRSSLKQHYPEDPQSDFLRYIENGWEVVGCSFKPGEIEKGQSGSITLELVQPPEAVFFGQEPTRKG